MTNQSWKDYLIDRYGEVVGEAIYLELLKANRPANDNKLIKPQLLRV